MIRIGGSKVILNYLAFFLFILELFPEYLLLISFSSFSLVVNDSILLVTFIRNHMEKGESAIAAARKASCERFRAVLLTSLTTIMGLLPLMAERSMQAQILIPLACSVVFGLLMTTMLVLLLLPTIYSIFDDYNLLRKH